MVLKCHRSINKKSGFCIYGTEDIYTSLLEARTAHILLPCKQSIAGLWCPGRTVSRIIMHREFFTNPQGSEALHNILKCEHYDKTKDINTLAKVHKRNDFTFFTKQDKVKLREV